ncbi:MAG: general secretion pathway protein GspK [Verrucomicrobiae bacterium]|nr:general secretion pathway protein GspK [Verrucomicrobiae bacterium]
MICDLRSAIPRRGVARDGSALLLVLWLTIVLAAIVSVLAYSVNQQVEQTSYERRRLHAEALAVSALEYTPKLMDDSRMARGAAVSANGSRLDFARFPGHWRSDKLKVGDAPGSFTIEIEDAEQRLNVNKTSREVWLSLLELTDLTREDMDKWIDSLQDWTDADDAYQINGAENEYYGRLKPPYRARNAPLTHLGEIFLIKNGPLIAQARLKGGGPRILDLLTIEGDGRVNVNTAPAAVLAALGQMDLGTAQGWVSQRAGADKVPGTLDDVPLDPGLVSPGGTNRILKTQSEYFVVKGIGEVDGIQASRSALFTWRAGGLKKVKEIDPLP